MDIIKKIVECWLWNMISVHQNYITLSSIPSWKETLILISKLLQTHQDVPWCDNKTTRKSSHCILEKSNGTLIFMNALYQTLLVLSAIGMSRHTLPLVPPFWWIWNWHMYQLLHGTPGLQVCCHPHSQNSGFNILSSLFNDRDPHLGGINGDVQS